MIFSKRTIRTTSIQKLGRFIAAFGSYRSKTLKTVNFDQKWPNFCLKWPKFCQIRIFQAYIFLCQSKWYGDLTSCKKSEKISNGQGCRTGTDARMHIRERIYRFLPESKDIRGTKNRKIYSGLWKL